jgi:hypothetical protein
MKKNILIIALLISNIVFGILAYVQKMEADSSRLTAEMNVQEALRQRLMAEEAKKMADEQRALAMANERTAFEAYQKGKEECAKKRK